MVHMPPAHPVLLVRAPLVDEEVLGEEELQLLVGHVDAELLEAVGGQVLKARHVQQAQAAATRTGDIVRVQLQGLGKSFHISA